MGLKKFIETYGDTFPYSVTIVNQSLPDEPLIFVNQYFLNLTGHDLAEILGTNCRFLQSGKTSLEVRAKMRDSINSRLPMCQDLLNYKKNGELFYNRLLLIPFHEAHEKLILGLQHVIPVGQFRPKHNVPPNDLMDRTINPLSILLGLEHMADTRFNGEFQKMIEKIRAYILGL
jgi:hypothetical protein